MASSCGHRGWRWIFGAAVLPWTTLLVCFLLDVRLGQPHLFYRYSPWAVLRLFPAVIGGVIGGVGIIAVIKSIRASSGGRTAWIAVAIASYVALIMWTFFAPPQFATQVAFNLESPSHEGAFVREARGEFGPRADSADGEISGTGSPPFSIRDYVSRTFYERIKADPKEMRGRRILSNPPGMTVAAALCRRFVAANPSLDRAIGRAMGVEEVDDPSQRTDFASHFALAMAMTLLWGASGFVAYAWCRLWWPPLAASAIALGCVFNPATVNFTPGKDPAQLLTVLLLLYAWCAAYLHRRPAWGFVAGVVFAAATMMSLIHIWILAIVAAATLWDVLWHRFPTGEVAGSKPVPHRICGTGFQPVEVTGYKPVPHVVPTRGQGGVRGWIKSCALPAFIGGASTCVVAYVTLDWNIIETAWRVGLRYGQIQEGVIADPWYLTLVGLPLFLLFVGPMFWVILVAMRADMGDAAARLGRRMLWCATLVMTYSYFFANNNETPRLWIPFIPLLLVGMGLRRSALRDGRGISPRLWTVLVALQVGVTLAHWSLMDVRESEYRLSTGRMWD